MATKTLEAKQGIMSYSADASPLVLIEPIREKKDFKIVDFNFKASAEATLKSLKEGGLGSYLRNYEMGCFQMAGSDNYKLVFFRMYKNGAKKTTKSQAN